ncbi:MAG: glycosyltransferase family 39 protein [Planctomycetota bacterium]
MNATVSTNSGNDRAAALAARFVLLIAAVLATIGIDWGLPNLRSWAADALEPALVLRGLGLAWGEDWWSIPRYPPFHFVVLGVAFAPYLLYLRLFDEAGWDIVATFLSGEPGVTLTDLINDPALVPVATNLILIARIVSVLMGVGTVGLAISLGRRLFGPWCGVFAGFLIAAYYPFVYHAHVANTDVPQLFWAMLSFHALARALTTPEPKRRDWIVSAVAAAASVATKDGAAGLFLGVPLLFLGAFGPKQFWQRRETWLWIGASLAAFAVTTLIVFRPTLYPRHVETLFGAQFERMREVADQAGGNSGKGIWPPIRLLLESLTIPGAIAIGLGCLGAVSLWPRRALAVLVPALVYFTIIVLGTGWVYLRFLLPCALALFLLGAAGLVRFIEAPPRRAARLGRGLLVAMALAQFWLYGPRLDGLLLDDPRDRLIQAFEQSPPRRGVLYLSLQSWSPAFLGGSYPVRYELLSNQDLPSLLQDPAFDRLVFQRLPSPLSDEPPDLPAVGKKLLGWEFYERIEASSSHPALRHIALQPIIVIGRRP